VSAHLNDLVPELADAARALVAAAGHAGLQPHRIDDGEALVVDLAPLALQAAPPLLVARVAVLLVDVGRCALSECGSGEGDEEGEAKSAHSQE